MGGGGGIMALCTDKINNIDDINQPLVRIALPTLLVSTPAPLPPPPPLQMSKDYVAVDQNAIATGRLMYVTHGQWCK